TYVPPVTTYDSTTYVPSTSTYQSSYYSPAQSNNVATVTVTVPPNAEVWFNGTYMTQTGAVRQFTSPPLTPGRNYTYRVTARGRANGQQVVQSRDLAVTAGGYATITFPAS